MKATGVNMTKKKKAMQSPVGRGEEVTLCLGIFSKAQVLAIFD